MVGRYRILSLLGAGAMGEVYLASDDSLARKAAVKILGTKHLGSSTIRERFLREARALARLSHPHLITVFEAGHIEQDDRPYYAMEILGGGDTQRLLEERGPMSAGVVALIGAQAAAGLGEAARAGITHRDVKPANLGITGQGVLKVSDFGLAKSFATEKSLTGKGMVVGTADYIAPEQARGEALDERADVYALGCSLFHLLTGKPPFRCEEGTEVRRYVEVMRAHLTAPVPDPRTYAAHTDAELAVLVMDCMDKDRDRRPTFDEMAPALARVAGRLGGELPRLTRKLFTIPTGTPVITTPPPEVDGATMADAARADTDAPESTSFTMTPATNRGARIAAVAAVAVTVVAAVVLLATR
jgi:serine/threonine-protein kinase